MVQGFIARCGDDGRRLVKGGEMGLARSEGFEPPTLGIEIRCSIQLSYERKPSKYKGLGWIGVLAFCSEILAE